MSRKYVEPFKGPLDQFPDSDELPEGVKTVSFKDTYGDPIDMRPDVVYAERSGEKQHLQIIARILNQPFQFQLHILIGF